MEVTGESQAEPCMGKYIVVEQTKTQIKVLGGVFSRWSCWQGQLGKMNPPLNLLPPMSLDRVTGSLRAQGFERAPSGGQTHVGSSGGRSLHGSH